MRDHLLLLLFSLPFILFGQLWDLSPVASIPEPVSNNAIAAVTIGDTSYVYSFGGIDSTKRYSGIHLRSYRYNTVSDHWESIGEMPDTLGKIAAGASCIGHTIYIMGGYHVFASGNERSSDRVHRFNVLTNSFEADGTAIPVPIDDHVQAIWRDSLIFLVTGWSNTQNVPSVQIYDPGSDQWQMGTAVPNNTTYNSFGASGYIVEDTIYYFGGAAYGSNFPIQNDFRKGVIDPQNPTQIQWQSTVLSNSLVAYRAGAIRVYEYLHWIGGSAKTYNYDGIAYDGSGGVPPSLLNFFYHIPTGSWNQVSIPGLPMDLRGVAEVSAETKYLIGGMQNNQQVTDQCLLLTYDNRIGNDLHDSAPFWSPPKILPNPVTSSFSLKGGPFDMVGAKLTGWDIQGRKIDLPNIIPADHMIPAAHLKTGVYLIHISKQGRSFIVKMLKK